jgi:hypothetical protein
MAVTARAGTAWAGTVRDSGQAKAAPDAARAVVEQSIAEPAFRTTAAPVAGLAFAPPTVHRSAHDDDVLGGTEIDPETLMLLRSRSGRGIPLPADTAHIMGDALATDLSGVSLHVDAQADQIARSLQATAFTLGTDVYFSSNSYAPGTATGQRLLAHELAHVAQGAHGAAGEPGTIGRADDRLERDADATADRVLRTLRRQAAFTRR